ncbi:hypothetical protein Plhal304r1_c008g0034231 [Plasmopara halstedii]
MVHSHKSRRRQTKARFCRHQITSSCFQWLESDVRGNNSSEFASRVSLHSASDIDTLIDSSSKLMMCGIDFNAFL